MDQLVGQAPAIIAEAAKSALGIFALMIMALSVIGFMFFRTSSERTRIAIFALMFLGVASFGVATVRSTSQRAGVAPATVDAVAIAGDWAGEVTYSWGDRYEETFSFRVQGSRLVGTASYLRVPRGIVDGNLDGNHISFYVQLDALDGPSYRNEYSGLISGDTIHFTLQDTRGNPPVEFLAVRESPR